MVSAAIVDNLIGGGSFLDLHCGDSVNMSRSTDVGRFEQLGI